MFIINFPTEFCMPNLKKIVTHLPLLPFNLQKHFTFINVDNLSKSNNIASFHDVTVKDNNVVSTSQFRMSAMLSLLRLGRDYFQHFCGVQWYKFISIL